MKMDSRVSNSLVLSKFVPLKLLTGTSVTMERVFSHCSCILTNRRKSMSPTVFDAFVCLKVNRYYWSVDTVASYNVQDTRKISTDNGEGTDWYYE